MPSPHSSVSLGLVAKAGLSALCRSKTRHGRGALTACLKKDLLCRTAARVIGVG